jgi:hypothetical protein
MNARGTFRCCWLAAVPNVEHSDDGYPSSQKLATPSRGTPIWSYITPRPQPMVAGTTIRCIRHSESRLVAGFRTLVIRAWRSADDQQLVAVTPVGTGMFVWSYV